MSLICRKCENLFESKFDGKPMCIHLDCVKGSRFVDKKAAKKIEPIRLDKSVRETENFWRDK